MGIRDDLKGTIFEAALPEWRRRTIDDVIEKSVKPRLDEEGRVRLDRVRSEKSLEALGAFVAGEFERLAGRVTKP